MKIIQAANHIVQNLAGSLALVTCREPLRMQLTNHIKKELRATTQAHLTDPAQIREVNEMLSGTGEKTANLGARGNQEE